jgi:hypothetical protein
MSSVVAMTKLAEIQSAILQLDPTEQERLLHWLDETVETPEMLAAIDEGVRSLEKNGAREYTRTELQQKVTQWARGDQGGAAASLPRERS